MGKGKKTRVQKTAAKAARRQKEMARQWANHQTEMLNNPEKFGYSKKSNWIEDVVYEDKDFKLFPGMSLFAFFISDGKTDFYTCGAFQEFDGLSAAHYINGVYRDFKHLKPHKVIVIRLNDGTTPKQAKALLYSDEWNKCALLGMKTVSYDGGAYVKQDDFERIIRQSAA